jgi:2-dehydropantoate 2-reductase
VRIGIFGTGAIGGLLGARLALAGEEVTAIDRGPQLEAIRRGGLELIGEDGSRQVVRLSAAEQPEEAGPQDIVILGVKAYDLGEVAPRLAALLGPETAIVTVQNGIPWWYFHRHPGPLEGQHLRSADPDGALSAHIDGDRIVGCVVYPAAVVEAPGIIRHVEGHRLPVGEPDGSKTERVQRISDLFERAGFRSRVLDDVRSEIWLKAWGNLSFNPVSALTHATLEDICRFPETRALAATMMEEAQDIAAKLGVRFRHTIQKRIAGAEAVGPHKTSMLQDVEAGRTLEVEALVGTVLELGELTGTPAPATRAVCALTRLLDRRIRERGVAIAEAKPT